MKTQHAVDDRLVNSAKPSGSATRTRSTLATLLLFVLAITAVLCLFAGTVVLYEDRTQRDSAGFLVDDDKYEIRSGTTAIASASTHVRLYGSDRQMFRHLVGRLSLSVTSHGHNSLFVGLASTKDLERYLADVSHDEARMEAGNVSISRRLGATDPAPPASQTFWTQSHAGPGTQSIRALPHNGRWSIVVMNADATPGIRATVAMGAEVPSLPWIGLGLVLIGVIIAATVARLAHRLRRPVD